MLFLFGSALGMDSNVFLPMIIECPNVSFLNLFKSSEICQISLLSFPNTLFSEAAAIKVISFREFTSLI